MRQVLSLSASLLRRPGVALASFLIGGCGMALVALPLLGLPGYELGEAMTAAIGLFGGAIGVAAAAEEKQRLRKQGGSSVCVLDAFFAAFMLEVLLLALPWAAAVAHALLRSSCDPFAHAAFYPLLTLPAAVLASAAGVFAGFLASTVTGAGLVYFVLLVASFVWTLVPLFNGPQVFAFNFFTGYFPGPLYDEALAIRPAIVWFEVETCLWATALLTLAVVFLDPKDGALRRPYFRPLAAMWLACAVLALAGIEARAGQLGLRRTRADVEEQLGGVEESEHFIVIYPKEKPRLDADRLVRDLEFRYAQIQGFLGGAPEGRIHVYVYRSPEEKQTLVGASSTQFAKPWQLSIHVNDLPFPHPTIKHELVHAMAAPLGTGPFRITSRKNLWPLMGIIEGFAVAGDNPAGDLTLHEWAAAMRREKLAPNVRGLLNPQGFYAESGPRAYTAAGSFLRYLGDTYGKEKLEALYAHGDFQAAYGRTLDALVTEWEKFLDAAPLDEHAINRAFARFHEGSLFARPCAREVATLQGEAAAAMPGDPQRALTLYQRCAQLQPGEPGFQIAVGGAYVAMGKFDDAAAAFSSAAQAVAQSPALAAQVALAQADLDWKRGRKDATAADLKKVLALKPGPDLERTAAVKLAATGDTSADQAIWAYFQPGHDDVRLLRLQLALDAEPDNAYLNYLLGRRLTQAGYPLPAIEHLGQALDGRLPDAVAREAWRLKIEDEFEAGDCRDVRADIERLPKLDVAFKMAADEWRERCDFEEQRFHGLLAPTDTFR